MIKDPWITSVTQSGGWIGGALGPWTITEQHLMRDGHPDPSTPAIVWSGGLGQEAFEATPATWISSGWAAFEAHVPKDDPSGVLFRPHWAHVLSDAPSCHHACETWGLSLALAPASMLTSSMIEDATEHFECIFRMCGPSTKVLLLEDLRLEDGQPRPCPAGSGVLAGQDISQLAQAHLGENVICAVLADHPEAAAAWLGT